MINPLAVAEHYNTGGILDAIFAALTTMGKDVDNLNPEDLAPIDAFHIRGREATVELANRIELSAGQQVLDVGCGIGGSARYLAFHYHCHVTGIDLTQEFIDVANALSQKVGISETTTYQQSSALKMPFDENSFDVVWTEHVQMNIADKAGFYREISRVLKPGGRLIFHDIFQGTGGEIHFPVPWAVESSISHLATPDAIRETLENTGFQILDWEDKTSLSLDWMRTNAKKAKPFSTTSIGIHILMGDSANTKLQNIARNLQENRVAVVQSVAEKC